MENKTILVASSNDFVNAFEKLCDGGTVVLTDSFELSTTILYKYNNTITVTANCGCTLTLAKETVITLGGSTVFKDIDINVKTHAIIAAAFSKLVFGDNVSVNADCSVDRNGLYLVGGEYKTENAKSCYEENTYIAVYSGTFNRIIGFSANCDCVAHSGKASITVDKNAHVRTLIAGAIGSGASAGSVYLSLGGNAIIENFIMGGSKKDNILTGDVDMFVDGGDIYCFDYIGLSAVKGTKNLTYIPQKAPAGLVFLAELAHFDSIKTSCELNGHSFTDPFENPFGGDMKIHQCTNCGYTETVDVNLSFSDENVVFVADGGFCDGSSPFLPTDNFEKAIEKLGDDGGTVVLVGKYTLPVNMTDRFEKVADAFQEPRHSGKITITCKYKENDYRKTGSALSFEQNMDYRMSGPVEFESITITANSNVTHNRIIARYNPLVIGDDCVTPTKDGYKLDIIGGYLQFRYTDLDGYKFDNEFDEIVNSYRPLPQDFGYDDLTPIDISPKYTLRREAAEAFNKMYRDMAELGLKTPYISDASRTYERQYQLFTNYVCRLRRTYGYNFETARKVVLRSCSLPLCSEHHRGVAVDMYDADLLQFGGKKHHFYNLTQEWAWVCENGKNYGIVLRYPLDKTDITGTIYEVWHFSYVGKATAMVLKASNYVMEEYMGAKLGLFCQNSSVTVKSGTFNSITAYSKDIGKLQFIGSHLLSISNNVTYNE